MDIQGTHLYNQYKFSQNNDEFDEFKKCRNLVNRKVPDEHHIFSFGFLKQCETSRQKWNFMNKKLENHTEGINVSEIEKDGANTVDKKAICKASSKFCEEMSKYSGDFVPLNIHKLDHCYEKINFRQLTSKEIYKTIDSLENSKSSVPGFVHAWALKAAKYAIGTQLQFIFKEPYSKQCLSNYSKTCICHTNSQKSINSTSVQQSTNFGHTIFC